MSVADLTWVDPTARVDGSPIVPDTFSVKVYDTANITPGNAPIATVAHGVQAFTTGPLAPGPHGFALVAEDSEGDDSIMTAVVNVTVGFANPNPPTDLKVVVR